MRLAQVNLDIAYEHGQNTCIRFAPALPVLVFPAFIQVKLSRYFVLLDSTRYRFLSTALT